MSFIIRTWHSNFPAPVLLFFVSTCFHIPVTPPLIRGHTADNRLLSDPGCRDRRRARSLGRDLCGPAVILHAIPPAAVRPRENVQRVHGDLAVLLGAAARPERHRAHGLRGGRGRARAYDGNEGAAVGVHLRAVATCEDGVSCVLVSAPPLVCINNAQD